MIEDAPPPPVAAGRLAVAGPFDPAKKPVEDEGGVDLLGGRAGLAPPGQVDLVGATVAVVASARVATAFAADLQRGELRRTAHRQGGDLVGRDPGAEVGPAGLPGMGAGQEAGHRPGMVPPAVAVGPSLVERQAREDQEVIPDRGQGSKQLGQLEATALRPGRPVRELDAVGDVKIGQAIGAVRGGRAGQGRPGHERFEPGQGDRGSEASEGGTSRGEREVHGASPGCPARLRNAGLSTIARTRVENRASSRTSLRAMASMVQRSAGRRPRPRA